MVKLSLKDFLFASMAVTVDKHRPIGGRNQPEDEREQRRRSLESHWNTGPQEVAASSATTCLQTGDFAQKRRRGPGHPRPVAAGGRHRQIRCHPLAPSGQGSRPTGRLLRSSGLLCHCSLNLHN
jgi:hypothetical protein